MTTPYQSRVHLKPGDRAPRFAVPSHPSGTEALVNYLGKQNVVLAFYPFDDTPGCTLELCHFSDDLSKFHEAGAEVLGISCNSVQSHQDFAAKFGLGVSLLADEDREVGLSYGAVRGGGSMPDRILFVIDKEGFIKHVQKGMPDNQKLLEVLRALP
jgi:thioredoxin-dependent peroxiredoxin